MQSAPRRPHVAFLVDTLEVGGAERVVEALAEDLPGEGFSVSVGCLRQVGPIGEALQSKGVHVVTGLAPRRYDPTQVWPILGHLRDVRADVVHTLDHSNVLLYGRWAARLSGKPQIAAIHRTRRADGSPSLGRFDRLFMGLSRHVIAVSRGHAEYLSAHEGIAAERLEVIYNGIDETRFTVVSDVSRARARAQLDLGTSGPIAVIVAALRPEKNHAGLLRALVEIDDLKLLVVGRGSMEMELRDEARRLGVADRVHWLGMRPDVNEILPAADFLVLPSRPAVETFPLCVLEAMACGLPVVATRVGSLDEMVIDGESARLVEAEDDVALASAMRELCRDPILRSELGAGARERLVSHFTRARMVQAHARLFGSLVPTA